MPPPKVYDEDWMKDTFPNNKFTENGQVFINSIRFKKEWLQCFFLFAVIWSFGVNLRDDKKQQFEEWMYSHCTLQPKGKRSKKSEAGSSKSNLHGKGDPSPENTDDEDPEESYEAEHIMAEDAKTGAFKYDPSSTF